MSSVVITFTPFINMELLLKSLDSVGCKYQVQGTTIFTDRKDYYENQKFVLQNDRYMFVHEEHAESYSWGNINMQQYKSSSSFIAAAGEAYKRIYAKQLEELEKKRLAAIAEQERIRKEQLAEQERLRLLAIAEEERKRIERLAKQEEQRLLEIAKKAEEEKRRLERERKEYVEKQKTAIIAKAKEQGYEVQEKMVDRKVKLVLVKTVY